MAQEQKTSTKIINVRVTNGNKDMSFHDKCEGIAYDFPAGKTVSIPLSAAKHIFGYDVKGRDESSMFNHTCMRWGWNTPANVRNGFKGYTDKDGKQQIGPLDLWSKFTFQPVAGKIVETEIIDLGQVAEDRDTAETPKEETEFRLGKTAIQASA
jgi:hypothetical protein